MDFAAPINAFVSGFPDFLLQLAVAIALFVGSLVIYVLMTPHKELDLVRAGTPSAKLAPCIFTASAPSNPWPA